MGKVVAVVCYIGGALVLFFGMVFMAIAFTVPMAVGGPLLIFGLLIVFIGVVLIYLGDRSYRKNQVHIQG
jgi:membrane protein implicated in regulation of membrane protease activity